jgi:hypothetical protein
MKTNPKYKAQQERHAQKVKAANEKYNLRMEELRHNVNKNANTYRFKPDEKERERVKALVPVANHIAVTPKNYYANTSVYGRQRLF